MEYFFTFSLGVYTRKGTPWSVYNSYSCKENVENKINFDALNDRLAFSLTLGARSWVFLTGWNKKHLYTIMYSIYHTRYFNRKMKSFVHFIKISSIIFQESPTMNVYILHVQYVCEALSSFMQRFDSSMQTLILTKMND